MIDFSTLQGLTIPEGAVTQIADASGNVLWKLANDKPIILEVEKITSDTYAGETTYTGEQFILLNIYPKTNGTVSVTYGGITKTITDTSGVANPNAQQVCFGTFNGVVHDTTPSSGTLIIEGGYISFGVGSFSKTSKETSYCGCVRSITSFGSLKAIGASAFRNCTGLNSISLENFTSIGANAFADTLATTITLSNIKSVGDSAFYTGAESIIATINGLPKDLPHFAIRGSSVRDSFVQIYINDPDFSWDVWANTTSRPYTGRIDHESTGDTDTESINVYFNGTLSTDITSVELRDCTRIANYAFYNFNRADITFPNSVTDIGTYAFYCCYYLTFSSLPSGLKTIGAGAFDGCNIPESLTIPASVTSIGSKAFKSINLQHITVLATTPPNGGTNMFGSGVVSITVPAGCGDAYKAKSGWSDYADKIVEAS